jgi:hypothetical protein
MHTSPLFPVIVGRQGGASVELLDALHSGPITSFTERIGRLEDEVSRLKKELSEQIYALIGHIPEGGDKKLLIQAKRDLFHDRLLNDLNDDLQAILPVASTALLSRYRTKKQEYREEYRKFCSAFSEVLPETARQLLQFAKQGFFQNGLLFSSSDLLSEVQKCEGENWVKMNKKNRRLALSLLKYLTRSVTKTTPFSSFNQLFFLEAAGNAYVPLRIPVKQSFLQINNLLFHYLQQLLMRQVVFREKLMVKNNTSVWRKEEGDNCLHFFVNQANNEFLKTVPPLETVYEIRLLLEKSSSSYHYLLTQLEKRTGEERETVQGFTDTLIREGMLLLVYPVESRDNDWPGRLLEFFRRQGLMEVPLIGDLAVLLTEVTEAKNTMEQTQDTAARQSCLLQCYRKTMCFFERWKLHPSFQAKLGPHDLFYEDTTCNPGPGLELNSAALTAISNDLLAVYRYCSKVSPKRKLRMVWSRQLRERSAAQMPLLNFYHHIYLPTKTNALLSGEELEPLQSLVRSVLENAGEGLPCIDLKEGWPGREAAKQEDLQLGAHLQPAGPAMEKVVLNNFTAGYGKNISRFLKLLPQQYAAAIQQFNQKKLSDTLIADTRDASIHNLNNYPPLTQATLDSIGTSPDAVPLSSIWVTTDPEHGIKLIDHHGQDLRALNFSMESLSRRSSFLQFLDILDPTDLWGYQYFKDQIKAHFRSMAQAGKMAFMPRIVFGDRLVLLRRSWMVTKEILLQLLKTAGTPEGAFLAIDRWRKETDIPRQVFLRIDRRGAGPKNNDHYKPQFIDFASPIFILLLDHLLRKAGDVVELEEVYPNLAEVKQHDGYVREYLFNFGGHAQ